MKEPADTSRAEETVSLPLPSLRDSDRFPTPTLSRCRHVFDARTWPRTRRKSLVPCTPAAFFLYSQCGLSRTAAGREVALRRGTYLRTAGSVSSGSCSGGAHQE